MLQNFYLKIRERESKTHGGENALVKGNDTISLLFAYSFVLIATQDSLVGRWTKFSKGIMKTAHIRESRNKEGVNIHPRR